MADRVKVNCPLDDEVEVLARDITLVIGDLDQNRYIFRCPRCQLSIEKRADEKILGLLMLTDAGVSVPSYVEEGGGNTDQT